MLYILNVGKLENAPAILEPLSLVSFLMGVEILDCWPSVFPNSTFVNSLTAD